MATESWNGHNNCHAKAPWEKDVPSDSNSYIMELHGFQARRNSSQCSTNSIDVGAVQCSYRSFSYSADSGVNYSRQLLYFPGALPSTNPYFGDPDLKYTFYGPPVKARYLIPPPWEDDTNHAISTHPLTNPYLNDFYNYIDGANGHSFNNNSSSISSYRDKRCFESFLSEAEAKNTALYGNGFRSKRRTPPRRSVSDKRMSPSEASKQLFMRSLSFDSVIKNQITIPQYTKARSLVEEVLENVVKKMVCAQSRANMVPDMIFNPSSLCKPNAPIDDDTCFSRKLMQRILLLQIRELGPKLMVLAVNEAEFKSQNWALNGQIRQNYPNPGLRLLLLQQRFMDMGMEAFDVVTKLRSQIPHMASEDGFQGTGILRIAVMAGNPGCSALGSHLFFLQHFPSLAAERLGSQEYCEGEIGGNNSMGWLQKDPSLDHRSDSYEDFKSDYHPALFSALERHLPPHMLDEPKDVKLQFLGKVVSRYAPRGERNRVQRQREYRERILNDYQPLDKGLYTLNPDHLFVQTFIDAVKENTQESFKGIVMEPLPGVYTFDMLQKGFCQLLIDEVENFEEWVDATKFDVVRPNTMNKYGVVLDDFGFDQMLDKLMTEFIKPLASVLFPDVGGSTLDTHHGFVVEYSKERDLDLGFHVDDSEVTLNVCLGKHFTGGELFFRGVRCEKHVNDETHTEEIFEYSHNPGCAIMHAGRHRHGVKEIASGHRTNLILWCRSSVFRELRKHQCNFSSWCGECLHQKKERRKQLMEARHQEILYR